MGFEYDKLTLRLLEEMERGKVPEVILAMVVLVGAVRATFPI